MRKPHLCFRAYLAALLMLAAVPGEAADVKELFAIDLADYPSKEGRMIEVSYPPGAQDVVHHSRRTCVRLRDRWPDCFAVESLSCRHAQVMSVVLGGAIGSLRRWS